MPIAEYLNDANLEVEGDPEIMGEAFQDDDGDEVQEVGARTRRRGSRGRFNFRRFRIPAAVIRRATGAPVGRAKANAYRAPSEGGALTPFGVGQANPAALTLTSEPQSEYQPLRMIAKAYDSVTGVDVTYKVRITEIKVGARTMLRAGGSVNGLPLAMFAENWTGANPARFDAIRPGTRFTVTFANLAGNEVADCALVGRAG